jgi:hypothetical protein
MAVIESAIKPGTRSCKHSNPFTREYGLTLHVVTDSKLDGSMTVLGAADWIPQLWSYYDLAFWGMTSEIDAGALCVSRVAKDIAPTADGGFIWEVELDYQSDVIQKAENPLDDPVLYSLNWAQYEKVIEKDTDGKPLANTVGDLFTDPPYTQDDSRPVLIVRRNEAELPIASAIQYKDKVNSDTFYGADPGHVKCTNINTSETQTRNGVTFYTVSYEFQFNNETFQPSILNRGHRSRATAGGKIADNPNKEARNLLADGTLKKETDDPYYIDFTTFESVPFGALGV